MADAKPAEKKPHKAAFKYVPGTKFCPKCGAKMAAHEDRFSCGRCSYTEWKSPKGK